MRDDGGASVQLGDGAQVDSERQFHFLTLAQPQARRVNEHASSTEVNGFAQRAATIRHDDVHECACTMSGVYTPFHDAPSVIMSGV
jgi:hypothetical protein